MTPQEYYNQIDIILDIISRAEPQASFGLSPR